MRKKILNKRHNKKSNIIVIGISLTVIGLIIYGCINFLRSLNVNFLLSSHRSTYFPTEGYPYTSKSIGTTKSLNSGAWSRIGLGHNPTISLNQGQYCTNSSY